MGEAPSKFKIASRALLNLLKGMTLWSAHNLVMAVVIACTLSVPLLTLTLLELLSPLFAAYAVWWAIPYSYAVPVAGLVYAIRRVRAVAEDVPEIGESFQTFRDLRDDTWDVQEQGGGLSVVEDASTSGGLSVSAAATRGDLATSSAAAASARPAPASGAHVYDAPPTDDESTPAKGFFTILWRMSRGLFWVCAAFIFPSWWFAAVLGVPPDEPRVVGVGIFFLFMSSIGAATYHGHALMSDDALEERHNTARMFGILAALVIVPISFLSFSLLVALELLVPPLLLMGIAWAWSRTRRPRDVWAEDVIEDLRREAARAPEADSPTARSSESSGDAVLSFDGERAPDSVSVERSVDAFE